MALLSSLEHVLGNGLVKFLRARTAGMVFLSSLEHVMRDVLGP